MDTSVIVYGDTVVVEGFAEDGKQVQLEGTVVGITEYCYTIKDSNNREWDADLSTVTRK